MFTFNPIKNIFLLSFSLFITTPEAFMYDTNIRMESIVIEKK